MASPIVDSSFFLFGARGTGKTSWLKSKFGKNAGLIWVDLLDEEEFLRFTKRPQTLAEIIPPDHDRESIIVIDEIQKVPALLNYAHKLIEAPCLAFTVKAL